MILPVLYVRSVGGLKESGKKKQASNLVYTKVYFVTVSESSKISKIQVFFRSY